MVEKKVSTPIFGQGYSIEEEKSEKKTRKRSLKIFTDRIFQGKEFMQSQPFFYDKNKLWWIWNYDKFCYEMTDEVDILNRFKDTDEEVDIINSKIRTEIINACKQVGRLSVPQDPKPTWIQFKDKIIDIETEETFDPSPKYFITNPINWCIGDKVETPAMDILFDSWVGEDHREELYEIMAFCLVPNYFIHRMFCLIGSGANGKSTFLKILEKFIGEENITSSSLYLLLTQRFEGSKLYKKLMCLMGETNFNLITNTDFLKKLTGEDLVRAEFKGKDSFDFRNYAKLIMATNSLPPTADKTAGFYRRWKIIKFPNKFDKESDILINVSDGEYEALTRRCFNIAKRIWKERTFTNEGDFDERKRRYEDESNPLMKFIKENFEKDINGSVIFQEFYDGFVSYLEERGQRVLSAKAVGSQLKSEGFESKVKVHKDSTARFILGLKKLNKTGGVENESNRQGGLDEYESESFRDL